VSLDFTGYLNFQFKIYEVYVSCKKPFLTGLVTFYEEGLLFIGLSLVQRGGRDSKSCLTMGINFIVEGEEKNFSSECV
jgi:hypothetical protein